MDVTFDGELVMPSSYVLMDEEEMMYVEGGTSVQLYVSKSYLSKSNCKSVAAIYASMVGLTTMRVAKEIYAHAKMYYMSVQTIAGSAISMVMSTNPCTKLASASVLASMLWIKDHSNPIDLGGDSDFRVAVYNGIWNSGL